MIRRYVPKVRIVETVEAVQFLGDQANQKECMAFCPAIMLETYMCNESLYYRQHGVLHQVKKTDWIVKHHGEYIVMTDKEFTWKYVQKGF